MNNYKITPSINYAAFTDFIYNKLKGNGAGNYDLQHQSCDLANDIIENSKEIYPENEYCIWKVIVSEINNKYIKEFTESLNLKEDYYIIFTD